jgi:fluoride exporter
MQNVLWVALGGAIGSAARYGINNAGLRLFGNDFPWATLFVNVVGCFLMGLVAMLAAARWELSEATRLFLTTGILGGFTTFSAFALDVAFLTQDRSQAAATGYVMASVAFSIAAVFAGMALARNFTP